MMKRRDFLKWLPSLTLLPLVGRIRPTPKPVEFRFPEWTVTTGYVRWGDLTTPRGSRIVPPDLVLCDRRGEKLEVTAL
jgi:hypothetical protein